MENYMDRFSTPEEYIRTEILSNRGTQNIADKSELAHFIATDADEEKMLAKLSKDVLFDKLVELKGDEAYRMFPVGVSSYSFQLKFGITNADVKRMAQGGIIRATGKVRFRKFGKYLYADTCDPYAYFRLTAEEVHAWLKEHPTKSKEEKTHDTVIQDRDNPAV